MQCPWCLEFRYSRDWKPSQWTSWSPVTDEFNACKKCSPTGVCTNTAEMLLTWQMLRRAYNYVAGDCHLRSTLSTVIETWMTEIPSETRKELSYRGDIASRVRPAGVFDPRDGSYHLGMKLVFPELLAQYGWNAETCGDIFEAFLGLGFTTDTAIPSVRGLARWLDYFLYYLYKFCVLVQDRSLVIKTFADCEQIASTFSPL